MYNTKKKKKLKTIKKQLMKILRTYLRICKKLLKLKLPSHNYYYYYYAIFIVNLQNLHIFTKHFTIIANYLRLIEL